MIQDEKKWLTDEARKALDIWASRYRPRWEIEGADPDEIRSDLETHLWRSRKSEDTQVDVVEVESAIAEMGLPGLPKEPQLISLEDEKNWYNLENTSAGLKSKTGCLAATWALLKCRFLAGAWPMMVIVLELVTGVLGNIFFDPMLRISQIILLLVIGLIGVFANLQWSPFEDRPWMKTLRGAAAISAGYYAILILPVIAIGTIIYFTVVAYSFGMALIAIPIFLICVLIAAAPILLFFGLLRGGNFSESKLPWLTGFLVGLFVLLVVEGPAYLTRYGVANDKISLVRSFGSEETLHLMCYEGSMARRTLSDTSGFVSGLQFFGFFDAQGSSSADHQKARQAFYQVTGRSPDTEEPKHLFSSARGRDGSSVVWDENLGGDGVSARIEDLDLAGSRLDGHLDSASQLGYWEWTMTFSNQSSESQEARMQLLLPSNGVVTRLTLWVNGEPQEAAFSSTAKVTKAYKTIAVRERRDPVLARWVGADRVMVQCFPVPSHDKMQIRVGITAPLDQKDRLALPRIIEKNFGIGEDLETAIWIQGDLEMELDGLQGDGAKGKWRETHGTLSAIQLMDQHTHVQSFPTEKPGLIWTRDQFANDNDAILIREQKPATSKPKSQKLILVIDGSGYFSEWAKAADSAIEGLRKSGLEVEVFVAVEEEVIQNPESLAELDFKGGQDCAAALEAGLAQASGHEGAMLIWLHGQQPIEFSNNEKFFQTLERGFHQIEMSVVDLTGGPNRLLEKLARKISLAGSGRPTSPADLADELSTLAMAQNLQTTWSRKPESDLPTDGTEVWDQLARWQVWQLVRKASLKSTDREQLAELAAKYQLVTPVSGAVVLESSDQYNRFGLEQIDPDSSPSIPGIPEPSSALLSLLALTFLWKRQRPSD